MTPPVTQAEALASTPLGALRALGYVEGTNVATDYRYADGTYDRLPLLAAQLRAQEVDIVVTEGTPPSLLLRADQLIE